MKNWLTRKKPSVRIDCPTTPDTVGHSVGTYHCSPRRCHITVVGCMSQLGRYIEHTAIADHDIEIIARPIRSIHRRGLADSAFTTV